MGPWGWQGNGRQDSTVRPCWPVSRCSSVTCKEAGLLSFRTDVTRMRYFFLGEYAGQGATLSFAVQRGMGGAFQFERDPWE